MPTIDEDPDPLELDISDEKLCFIILKAREFDAKVDPVEPDPGSNPAADDGRGILEDYDDDATLAELRDAIESLDEDEVIDVIALLWIGRGDFTRDEWDDAKQLATERHLRNSAAYLLGTPTLADDLDEGLVAVGHSCADVEAGHL
jgi:hypothetical protein